jgi:LysM domain
VHNRVHMTAGLVLAGCSWLAWRATRLTWATATGADARVDDLVGAMAATALLLMFAWVWVVLIAHAAAALPGVVGRVGDAVAAAVTPAVCRGAVRLVLGLVTVAAPFTPAAAFAGGSAATTTSTADVDKDFADLPGIERPAMVAGWVPSVPPPRPPAAAPHSDVRLVATSPSEPEAVLDEVVIRRGDTLWDIAARALGTHATAAEIATEWPRWYAANRDVIGADPDVIHPGTVLQAPGR